MGGPVHAGVMLVDLLVLHVDGIAAFGLFVINGGQLERKDIIRRVSDLDHLISVGLEEVGVFLESS